MSRLRVSIKVIEVRMPVCVCVGVDVIFVSLSLSLVKGAKRFSYPKNLFMAVVKLLRGG